MELGKFVQAVGRVGSRRVTIAATTLATVAAGVACLSSGYYIIFQNLFYVPIVIACICYGKRGFLFSVAVAVFYFCLILVFTRDPVILLQAMVRSLIFVLVAGIIAALSSARSRAERLLRQQHGQLENLVRERTAELEADIAIRRQVEEGLRLKNHVFDVSLAANSIAGLDGVITEVNSRFLQTWGYSSRDEVVARPISDFLSDPAEAAAILEVLNAEGQWEGEYAARKKDGSLFVAHGLATIVRDAKGETIGYQSTVVDMTDSKRMEKELAQAKEAQFRSLIELLPAKVFLKDRSSAYLACNQSYAEDLEIKPDEIVGRTDYDFFPTHLAEKSREEDQRIMVSGKAEIREEEYHVIKGYLAGSRTSYVHIVKAPIRDADGNVTGLLGLFWDVTERKKAEEALKESEATLRTHIENSFDIIFTLNKEGVFLFVSSAWERHFGYPVRDVIGKPFVPFVHPDDVTPLTEYLERVLISGKSETSPAYRVKHADGNWRWFVSNGTPYVDAQGELRFIGVGHDITESRKAEQDLRESRELLLEMTSRVPGVVYQFYARPNGERGFYYVSEKSKQIFGVDPESKTFFEVFVAGVVPEYKEILLNSIEKAVQSMSEWKCEWLFQKPSGEKIWVAGNSIPLRRGEEIVFNGILTDITERKTLEEERHRVAGLKASADIKSKFTAMVSHEIRSPIAVVKEALSIVSEGMVGAVSSEQKNVLEIATGNVDRLSRLINNVLDFQKIESGKMEFDIQENDLAEVVAEVHRSMSILSKVKGLELRSELADGLPKIPFDRDKLIQVLTNLESNAINNTEKGSVTVSVTLENEGVHVCVRDTGSGIRAEDISKLFRPFEQMDVKKGKRKSGTGLGLAISREIILAHHGEIWAESEVGKGTTCHFTLPLQRSVT